MTPPTAAQIDQLMRALDTFTRRFKVAEAAAAAENALNPLDAQALIYVTEHPGCGLRDVAGYLDVAMTTMSSAVDRLVAKALIERERPEANRRAVALTATESGVRVVGEHKSAYRDACRWMLGALDGPERLEFIRLTEKVASNES